jgi:hypothetical protein
MAFKREIRTRSGIYYALVESHRVNGKPRQKHLKYLGKSPNTAEIPIDPALAATIAQALMSGAASSKELKKALALLGLPVEGRLRRISLVFNPPRKRLTLRVE